MSNLKHSIMKNLFFTGFSAILISGLMLFSCSKETKDVTDIQSLTSASDNTKAELIFNNVSNIADQAYNSFSTFKSSEDGDVDLIGNCATITLDTTSNPGILTIDFGEENCLCGDGWNRRGKIIVTFTGPYRAEGTVITHSFEEYFVNDNKVMGTRIVTNAGRNDANNIHFIISVNGVIIKADGSGQFTWASNRNREWIEGEDTWVRFDDVYLITGGAHGQTANQVSYTMSITNPLRREVGCRHFVSGSFDFVPDGKPVRTLDYGDGECDNIATVTINGHTYTIHLH
jgi:hypothetical protein